MDFLLFVTGICIGSFLGALSYRFPRNVSVLKGRSWCDNCKTPIEWWQNIPLLSYVLLLGRCVKCHKKISLRYPLIELSTGLIFTLIGPHFYYLVLACIFVTIFVIDFEHQIIPDLFVFTGIVIWFLNAIIVNTNIFEYLYVGFLSAAFLLLLFLITKGRGMGLGDVKLAVLAGIVVGIKMVVVWLFTAFVSGAVIGIILILLKAAKFKSKIAFGPFLIAAIPITLIFGENLLRLLR